MKTRFLTGSQCQYEMQFNFDGDRTPGAVFEDEQGLRCVSQSDSSGGFRTDEMLAYSNVYGLCGASK